MSETVWKTVLFVTPYIRVKRGCAGDIAPIPTTAWRAVHRQSGTAFQAANGVCLLSEGILSFVEYAPRLRIVLPSRQKRMECASHFFRLQAIFCLYFVFLMSSSRLVGLFSESPKGSQGNKHTRLPGMAASQTYKGRHKEVF